MMQLDTLGLFIVSALSLTLLPGPDILFVLSSSIAQGWKKGITISLGLTSGIFIHTLIVVFGVGTVLQHNPTALRLIQRVGAGYLIYLGILQLKSVIVKTESTLSMQKKEGSSFWTGFIMNVTNPKVSLFFISFFPGFLFHQHWSYQIQFLFLGILFFTQALIVFSVVSLLADRLGRKIKINPQQNLWNGLQALVFFGIAFYLLLS